MRSSLVSAAILAAGCLADGAPPLARATVDTLPSGAIRVMSAGPTRWRDIASGWQLEEVWRTRGVEGELSELIDPVSLAVDEGGRIYLADRQPAVIKLFDAAGQFLRTIGREGGGPGEFRVAFLAARGGHLVAHDPQASRTSVFDTAGTFLRSWPSACCMWTEIHLDREGRIYIPAPNLPSPERVARTWLRYRLDGTPLDTLNVPAHPAASARTWRIVRGSGEIVMVMSIPFTPALQTTIGPGGEMLIGWSAEYAMAVSRTGRDTVQVFGRAWTPVPVTEQARRDTVDSMVARYARGSDPAPYRAAFRAEDIPSTLPAFLGLRVDEDGHRWVRLGPAAEGGVLYDVFGPDGLWWGPVRVPIAFSPWAAQHWGHGELVVVVTDEESRPTLVKYRIRK